MKKWHFVIVVAIVVIVLSNYATFWATDKVNQIKVLEEQVKKMEAQQIGTLNQLQDGPSK